MWDESGIEDRTNAALPRRPKLDEKTEKKMPAVIPQGRPRRACLRGAPRALPPDWVYIGRGSKKFDLPPSAWANPFAIGKDGSREQVLTAFSKYLAGREDLRARIPSLAGRTLACHCAPHEPCHADVLMREYDLLVGQATGEDDATSEEDELGQPKAPSGAGWRGRGDPLQAGHGARARGLREGGGLCSPGRWPPSKRRLPPLGAELADLLGATMQEAEHARGKGFGRRVICQLACAQAADDPLQGLDVIAAQRVEEFMVRRGFRRDGRPEHPGNVIDLELLGFVARELGDPDWRAVAIYRRGVRLGWHHRLPRTPAVYERKTRWAPQVGDAEGAQEWASNYHSVEEVSEHVRETFDAQCAQGMMARMPYAEAKARFGDRLRVAALGAVGTGAEARVIHDGSHHVKVNGAIRVRDQDEAPTAADALAVLDCEVAEAGNRLFGLAFDVSKAHRRVPVDERDWGLQACSLVPRGSLPRDEDEVFVNTVGTYGIGSAAYWFNRLGALIQRLALYVAGGQGLRWLLRFADDYLALVQGADVWRPLLMTVLLFRLFRVPLKWSKFRGGVQLDWIGYFLDLEGQTAGISERRSEWATRWCRKTASSRSVATREFREGLGRLAFTAGILRFVRPFLGPLYTWVSVVGGEEAATVPPMITLILEWVACQFEQQHQVPFGVPVRQTGERYRADAKAEGEKIVLGGWEVGASGGNPRRARWYSLRLTKEDIPWAYTRGDPFRSIAALELLATLVCVLVFEPAEPSLSGGLISLTAAGDNQSNGFTLDRLSSTKYPLYLVLMEVSEQLRSRNLLLSVAWRPRDENEEADALTNERFEGFDQDKRVSVKWADLRLLVLPKLVKAAEELFTQLREARQKDRPKAPGPAAGRARKRLRERDPW